jgi:hypothetical protein
VWDSKHHVLIRYGGHNQGGGGEQHSEIWTFDPLTAKWVLKEPNVQPPGICCGQQNVFDPNQGRYLRFPSFSGSHGWQWWREIYLNDSSVWSYDLAENKWRNLRPIPTATPKPLRCAAWDSSQDVVVLFGGETSSRPCFWMAGADGRGCHATARAAHELAGTERGALGSIMCGVGSCCQSHGAGAM